MRGVDLNRYPLDAAPDAAIRAARREIALDGLTTLPGFFTEEAVAETVATLRPKFEAESFLHHRSHNIYFSEGIPGLAPDHPALARLETTNRTLTADQAAGTPLADLYAWAPFAAFLAAVMDKPALHPMADPLAAVNVMTYRAGEALNWHFDRSEFTVTLLLEAPEAGGVFEYRPALRTAADPNYAGVGALLDGRDRKVRQAHPGPGDLTIFLGRDTAHRVTPPEGPRPRTIAVLSFFDRPGVTFTDEERIGFYGRSGPA